MTSCALARTYRRMSSSSTSEINFVVAFIRTLFLSRNVNISSCLNDKDLERVLMEQSRELYEQKTLPGLYFSQNMGNMYTPSLYYSLFSFLSRSETLSDVSVIQSVLSLSL